MTQNDKPSSKPKSGLRKALKICGWVLLWVLPILIAVVTVRAGKGMDTTDMPSSVRLARELEPDIAVLSKLPGILGAGIVVVDPKLNERMMLVYNVPDQETMRMLSEFTLIHGLKQSLFDIGGRNTTGILEVINGGSTCMPFKTTVMASQMPKLTAKIKTACLFGMPLMDMRYRHYFLFFTSKDMTLRDFEKHQPMIERAKQQFFLSWSQK